MNPHPFDGLPPDTRAREVLGRLPPRRVVGQGLGERVGKRFGDGLGEQLGERDGDCERQREHDGLEHGQRLIHREGDGQRLLRAVTGLGAHAGRVSRGVVNASLSPREEIAACFTGL